MREESLPAIVCSDIANVRYMTGFEGVFDDGANVALVITPELTRVYTDSRYSEAAEEAAEGTPWVLYVSSDVYVTLCTDLGQEGVAELAIESSVPYGRFRFVSEKFGGHVRVSDQWIEELRQVKEAAEVERIASAAALTDKAFEHILSFIKPGVRECDLGLELEVFMRTHGSTGLAFDPIVASGPNSARPHAAVTSREIEEGDLLTLDFGARVDGYCADMTRTVAIGRATDRQKALYDAVLEANEAAIAFARAGVTGLAIDKVARELLGQKGLSIYFGHGLGHGVGVEVHELPSVSPRGRESMQSGAVITIEPGVYIPEFGGVRIEDLVVIEEEGCRVLSHAPKELIEVSG